MCEENRPINLVIELGDRKYLKEQKEHHCRQDACMRQVGWKVCPLLTRTRKNTKQKLLRKS
ncbi:hypothetical protein ACFO25_13385 [Paenactinomyces guangxiensis]|uniref:Uncharacterized protein n=1 Tax=Paenactinomyces guangxiensis TaxID=1490290 RepID=A0A7W1WPB3_9BACL|nr:hypothetical protein [Paenactinomyces guangxiensis]MBA4493439.1 hypothetical protein [Paenactinomyces guangxiensis]MBH8590530.1 hypothetical protein [Paenactinomyces guangxiensis]